MVGATSSESFQVKLYSRFQLCLSNVNAACHYSRELLVTEQSGVLAAWRSG